MEYHVTLDHNCIIDLETGGENTLYLRSLIDKHRAGTLHLRVAAVGASEKQLGGKLATNFSEFQEKLKLAGLQDIEILPPLMRHDVSFYDHCLLGGPGLLEEEKIYEILFPKHAFSFSEFVTKHGEDPAKGMVTAVALSWRNKICDTQTMWCHIYHKGNIFVTSDEDFLSDSKKPVLEALGAGEILTPKQAAERFL